ncbi:MAG: 3-oxosteroid 1-dehydrogenase [Streptomyces sp.]|jgi:succinate dehydrogenase/fumarate reductase flavoprotein subunit|nr:3-oxosteroid 1-dehydrogenase [Streptomyces sp.]
MANPEVLVPEQAADVSWDLEADLLVVGGSIAGFTTALHAHELGASVIVLEKAPQIGGTARKAVAGMWVPNNRFMQEAGVDDRKEDALTYLARMARPLLFDPSDPWLGLARWEYELFEALYDNADTAFRALEAFGVELEQDADFPDYHMHLPEVNAPRGRELFPHNSDGSRGNGATFVARLAELVAEREIPVHLQHRAAGVIINDNGRVVGVRVETPGGEIAARGRKAVVFCSGGFTHNEEMRRYYLGGRFVGGCAAFTNEGDFHRIAQRMGIPLVHMDAAYMAPLVLEKMLNRDPEMMGVFAVPGDSLIIVNKFGRRAVNEKAPYQDRTMQMLSWDPHDAEYPNFLMFAIWDQRAADRFPGGFLGAFIPGPGEDTSHVVRGDTIEELAAYLDERLGKLAGSARNIRLHEEFTDSLRGTIERFNGFARGGVDNDFRRGETPIEITFHGPVAEDNHCPSGLMFPLADQGPYYATILAPGTLDTKGGPRVNTTGQVLGADERPVPGLYAVGNSTAAPTGQGYISGGMTFGPIITFSYLAANAAVRESCEE